MLQLKCISSRINVFAFIFFGSLNTLFFSQELNSIRLLHRHNKMKVIIDKNIYKFHEVIQDSLTNGLYFKVHPKKLVSSYMLDIARNGFYDNYPKKPYEPNVLYATLGVSLIEYGSRITDSFELSYTTFSSKSKRCVALNDSTLTDCRFYDYGYGNVYIFAFLNYNGDKYVYLDEYLKIPYNREIVNEIEEKRKSFENDFHFLLNTIK